MKTESSKERVEWYWMRLAAINRNHDVCRPLRNRFGLALQGRLTLTPQDFEDADYQISRYASPPRLRAGE